MSLESRFRRPEKAGSGSFWPLAGDPPAGGLIRPYESELGVLERVVDLVWLSGALWISLTVYGHGWVNRHSALAVLASLLFLLTSAWFEVYRDRRSDPVRKGIAALVAAWAVVVVGLLVCGYTLRVTDQYPRVVIGTWFLLAPVVLCFWWLLSRSALRTARRLGYNARRVAILGTGEEAFRVAETILQAPWMGLALVGMFDDRAPVEGRVPGELPCRFLGKSRDLLDRGA